MQVCSGGFKGGGGVAIRLTYKTKFSLVSKGFQKLFKILSVGTPLLGWCPLLRKNPGSAPGMRLLGLNICYEYQVLLGQMLDIFCGGWIHTSPRTRAIQLVLLRNWLTDPTSVTLSVLDFHCTICV